MKIEDSVLIIVLIIWFSVSFFSELLLYRYSVSIDRKNISEVMMVCDRVWLIEWFIIFSGFMCRLWKFLWIWLKIMMVLLIEKFIIDSRFVSMVRLNL